MAGPWFAVQTSGSDWKLLDTIWISNGKENAKARVELKVELVSNALAGKLPVAPLNNGKLSTTKKEQ